jgi:hypothetical protein
VPVDEIMDLSAQLEAGSIMMEKDAEGLSEAGRASIATQAEWIRRTATIFRALCYVKDADGKHVMEEWDPEAVPNVGAEVQTRSGGFPSVPYVKQADGTWKPKYVGGKPRGEADTAGATVSG